MSLMLCAKSSIPTEYRYSKKIFPSQNFSQKEEPMSENHSHQHMFLSSATYGSSGHSTENRKLKTFSPAMNTTATSPQVDSHQSNGEHAANNTSWLGENNTMDTPCHGENNTMHPMHMPELCHGENNPINMPDWAVNAGSILLFLLVCLCCNRQTPAGHRGSGIRQATAAAARRREERKHKDSERRDKAIKKCLIVKQVLNIDSDGNLQLGEVVSNENDRSADATAVRTEDDGSLLDENNHSTCMICLEPFSVGDVVAWSDPNQQKKAAAASATAAGTTASLALDEQENETKAFGNNQQQSSVCLHVFHRDCIVDWFNTGKKHNDCPTCRATILHIDEDEEDSCNGRENENGSDNDNDNLDDTSTGGGDGQIDRDSHSPLHSKTAFVIMNGLISQLRGTASYSLIGQNTTAVVGDANGANGNFGECQDDEEVGSENAVVEMPTIGRGSSAGAVGCQERTLERRCHSSSAANIPIQSSIVFHKENHTANAAASAADDAAVADNKRPSDCGHALLPSTEIKRNGTEEEHGGEDCDQYFLRQRG